MSFSVAFRKPDPAWIEHKGMRFLITYQPTEATIENFLLEAKKYNVRTIVRVCEASYKVDPFVEEGIRVIDMPFEDGSYPPESVISAWFKLLKESFRDENNNAEDACVAVHCAAGLGRAPVLVTLALMELGMRYEDAVFMIREKRRGAINQKQLCFLEKYRPHHKLHTKKHKLHSFWCFR